MPLCKRCNTDHFNFVKCAEVPAYTERAVEIAAERERRKVIPAWRADSEGRTDWVPSGPPRWGETRLSRTLKDDAPEAA